jgi:hypothetical protein
MSGQRSPRPYRLTWVGIGLLGLNWIILSACLPYGWLKFSWHPFHLVIVIVGWVFLSGPILLLSYANLRSVRDREVAKTSFGYALILSFCSIIVGSMKIDPELRSELSCFRILAGLVWFLGWPLAIRTVILARRLRPLPTPEVDE